MKIPNKQRLANYLICVISGTLIVWLAALSPLEAQVRFPIGTTSIPTSDSSEVELRLSHRFQAYNPSPKERTDIYDKHIVSPKSVNILDHRKKFYIHALEDHTTRVYTLYDFIPIGTINHSFKAADASLFQETTFEDRTFRTREKDVNHFLGKPVESCFTHGGKYLWVTYYRRSFDANAVDPSAVCIIDTETDKIVRVMPTAPLPKMIASSADSKTLAITNWGENTVTLVDISSEQASDFKYITTITIDRKASNTFGGGSVNRDSDCDNCLRGTVFTPDGEYLLIAKMGGNGIAVIDVKNKTYIGTIKGLRQNIRHLILSGPHLYLSTNKGGFIQRMVLTDLLQWIKAGDLESPYAAVETVDAGEGVRTIVADPSGRYLFAAANNDSKIVVIRTSDLAIIAKCDVDSYPVGMDISEDGHWLITTSQEKSNGGGRSVNVFYVGYK
jgi:DNA-binding beta-propeller fold protein YncE